MDPQEQTSNQVLDGKAGGSGAAPNWEDVGPSNYPDGTAVPGTAKYTTARETFIDAPLALCSNGTPNSLNITQTITTCLAPKCQYSAPTIGRCSRQLSATVRSAREVT